MLELLWVPAASPWYPSKSHLIMGWPSQATWPWELMKCGFTIMNFLPAAETPGGDSHPDWTVEQQGCNWVVTQLHDCITTLNVFYWIQMKKKYRCMEGSEPHVKNPFCCQQLFWNCARCNCRVKLNTLASQNCSVLQPQRSWPLESTQAGTFLRGEETTSK